jgi:putative flippase GtrA
MDATKLLKFAFVGGVGFVVDTLVFILLYQVLELDMMVARLFAFIVAATTTWLGNRLFTFSSQCTSNKLIQWQRFISVACFSAIPNFLVFKLVMSLINSYFLSVYIALALGVLTGMVSNFWLSERWVFATREPNSNL